MTELLGRLRPVLALDLGGTQLRTALIKPDGTLVGRRARRTPATADELVAAAAEALRETPSAARADGVHLTPVAIGISAPGPLDPASGTLIDPPNLDPTTWGLPLVQRLADELGLPATMDKDTNVAALGEGFFGAGRGLADFVYITVSTGLGGAIVSGGRLVHGPDGVAGELGHLTIDAVNGPLCGCGARGHLEAIASGTGIAAAARAAGLATNLRSAREVALAEANGDPAAARIMNAARDAFAAAVVTIVDVFNPDVVIVGGGLAEAEGERLLGPARERVAAEAFRVQARRARIVPAQLGGDVSLVGALILANAGLDPALAPFGLQPRAMRPGRTALTFHSSSGDDGAANQSPDPQSDPNRAVAIG